MEELGQRALAALEFQDVTPATRRVMHANGNRDTGPEMVVRRMLYGLGFRYRVNRQDLPGRPDVVFSGRRKVVFVHGCFWHHHACQGGRLPKTRHAFWRAKLLGNRARDQRTAARLAERGWRSLTVWECELPDRDALRRRLLLFLNGVEE